MRNQHFLINNLKRCFICQEIGCLFIYSLGVKLTTWVVSILYLFQQSLALFILSPICVSPTHLTLNKPSTPKNKKQFYLQVGYIFVDRILFQGSLTIKKCDTLLTEVIKHLKHYFGSWIQKLQRPKLRFCRKYILLEWNSFQVNLIAEYNIPLPFRKPFWAFPYTCT